MGIGPGIDQRLRGIAAKVWPGRTEAIAVARVGGIGIAAPGPARHASPLVAAALDSIGRQIAAERERWFPWWVAGFGSGIVLYFALLSEPGVATAIAAALAGAGLSLVSLRSEGGLRFLCAVIAAGCFGFGAAKLRTLRVEAPVVTREIGPIRLEGRIESVDIQAPNTARILLRTMKTGEARDPQLHRVRLTLTGAKAVAAAVPGAYVSALAVLRPPPEPAVPHGYDFARWAFFRELGGVGYTYGAPKPLPQAPPPTIAERIAASVERLRLSMTARIEKAIPGPDGAVAAALITGERRAISEDDTEAYRDSGLAHVLSISGVHLALAGLGIFWALRALLALSPYLALTKPIKKWAAVAAFFSASFYLVISGGGAPAVRSYLMLSAMLLAVIADRPALSMRGVAMAALALLAVEPEDVIDPSFQMSFAAVAGLIALAEWVAARPRTDAGIGRPHLPIFRRVRRAVAMTLAASLVATCMTTPFAIYHFDRAASFGLLANLLAEPVVAFVIMPFAALSVILMPFGLEAVPLKVMGWGVHAMTAIAHWVASLPGGPVLVRAWPGEALIAIVAGGLWIILWRTRWRWFGAAPIALGLALVLASPPPDLFVARDGTSASVRGPDGHLVVLAVKPDEYTAGQWLLRDGDRRDLGAAIAGAQCDEHGCVARSADGRLVALSLGLAAAADDCERAKIVIAAYPMRRRCREPDLVIDRFDVARNGAMAITLAGATMIVDTVAAARGQRPWSGLTVNDGRPREAGKHGGTAP